MVYVLAHELDEEEGGEDFNPSSSEENPGVDDGFFVGTRAGTDESDVEKQPPRDEKDDRDLVPREFPGYDPSLNPNVVRRNIRANPQENRSHLYFDRQFVDANGRPQVIPDINVYQQKKNLAQGMMDLALVSANANQLRYVLESYSRHPYYWFSLISISISLILQVI